MNQCDQLDYQRKVTDFVLDALFNPEPRKPSQSEMAQEWLEDLARRAHRAEDYYYRLGCTAEKIAEGIEMRREGI